MKSGKMCTISDFYFLKSFMGGPTSFQRVRNSCISTIYHTCFPISEGTSHVGFLWSFSVNNVISLLIPWCGSLKVIFLCCIWDDRCSSQATYTSQTVSRDHESYKHTWAPWIAREARSTKENPQSLCHIQEDAAYTEKSIICDRIEINSDGTSLYMLLSVQLPSK